MYLDEYAENLLKPCRPEVEFEKKIHFLQIEIYEKNEKIEILTEELNCQKNKISQLEQELENAKNENFKLIKNFEKIQISASEEIAEKNKNVFSRLKEKVSKK